MEEKPKIGRPSTFEKAYLDVAREHFEKPFWEDYQEEIVVAGVGIQLINKQRANSFPSMSGLALKLGVTRKQLNEWGKQHPEFQHILDHGREVIREFLLCHGVTGKYNAGFAKFVAGNLTDLSDDKKVTLELPEVVIAPDEQDL